MNKPSEHGARQNELDTEGQILQDFPYMSYL